MWRTIRNVIGGAGAGEVHFKKVFVQGKIFWKKNTRDRQVALNNIPKI